MEIVRIEKQNCVEVVYHQLRELIVSNQWHEGEKLQSEKKLGELFGVSRVVIREALQRLRSENMIVTRQGTGSFVANPRNYEKPVAAAEWMSGGIALTDKQYRDFVEFRCCIEFRAIELAVKCTKEEDLEKVGEALAVMESHLNERDAFSEADFAFHKAVVDCAKNEFFSLAMESVRGIMIQTFREMNKLNDSANWGLEIHRAVYEKLRERDARGAIAILINNNEYNTVRFSQFLEK